MLREARDSFLSEMELQLKCNLKRFWLTLKLESKHQGDRKSTRLNSSHVRTSRMPSSA